VTTHWLIKAVGCPEDFPVRVCGLLRADGVSAATGELQSAAGKVAVLTARPVNAVLSGGGSGIGGVIEVAPDDSPADIARVLDAGIAADAWFISMCNSSALDFSVVNAIIKGAGASLGFADNMSLDRIDDMETVLRELLMNATVHGNLELPSPGISLSLVGRHHEEVAKRLDEAPYRDRRVRVEAALRDGAVCLSVIDEGPGYEPGPGPGDHAYSGRGMKVVREFSDSVTLGEGGRRVTAAFLLTVSKAPQPEAREDVLAAVDSAVFGCKVLIVDDEEILVEMARFQLEDAGFSRLDVAFDGESAWRKIIDERPDLVILDHTMPGVTGLELMARARADDRFRDTPFILISAHEDREFRAAAYHAGATNVLIKPVEPDLLVHRVRQLLTNLLLLRRLHAYRRRVEQELKQAQRMQEALMPAKDAVEALSKNNDVHLAGRFQMSSELGGDWWGCTDFGDGRFGLYTVDFSGHGVGPAINTFRLHTLMRDYPPPLDGPGGYLTRLNGRLCDIIPRGQYATMLYGIVDVAERQFTYAATGTPPPIFGCVDGSIIATAECDGVPLGLSRRSIYEDRVIDLPDNGFLFLYSDVLLEGTGLDGAMLGDEGLMDLVRGTLKSELPERALDRLVEAFLARTVQPLEDDLTAVWLAF
tara:strand:- start:4018 stop:5958 length:1941 start_codon:yes stop_codon:yes gene_type:complete